MQSDKFELAFEQYYESEDYDIKHDTWKDQLDHVMFHVARDAFKAGWVLAGGEMSGTEKGEQ